MSSIHALAAAFWLAFGTFAPLVEATCQSPDLRSVLVNNNTNWSPQTTIAFPEDDEFLNATIRWTMFRPPTYTAAVTVGTEADVVTAIRVATANDIDFLVTGGRHGFGTTLGNLRNGLAIDLANLNSVVVDAEAATVTVGPGAHFADIFDPVYNAGFMLPTGGCSCVSVIGASLGAGIGRFSGLYGLTVDSLLSVRVVTAEGETLEASETQNSDLFWGIRGAGANLAVVTSATFKLWPLVNQGDFASYDIIFPPALNRSYFEVLASFDDGSSGLPSKLAVLSSITFDPESNGPLLLANYVYAGSPEEAEAVIAPILALGPIAVIPSVIPWNRVSADAAFGTDAAICQPGAINALYGGSLRNLDADTWGSVFDQMAEFYQLHPEGRRSGFTFEGFANQATLQVPDEATAYPFRDTKYNYLLQFQWPQNVTSVEDAAVNLGVSLREQLGATSGYDGHVAYVNYGHGDETLEQVYTPGKLPRLAQLKEEWDPTNVFGFHFALPTVYP